jgi:hypothetical protein
MYFRNRLQTSVNAKLREINATLETFKSFINTLHLFHPSNASTVQIGPWPHFLRFLNHTELETRKDFSGRVVSPSLRPLDTQNNITYKHPCP